MKHYKTSDNQIYAIEEGFEHFLPDGCVEITKEDADSMLAPTIGQIKARAWEAIKAERDRRKSGGVKVGSKWFHSDDASRIQQMGLVMMGASIPPDLQWKIMDGSFVAMTQAVAQSVFAAATASDQAIFAVAEGHRVAMEASADPAAYDHSTGWPAIFGE